MYCVALDPGGTTGICLVDSADTPWTLRVAQFGPEHHHAKLLHFLSLWNPKLIICEAFENRSHDATWLISREYIGVVKAYAQFKHCELQLPSSSLGKQFWNDDKLRKYGAYAIGMKHARDACRHYLYWQTFKVGNQSLIANECTATVAPMH